MNTKHFVFITSTLLFGLPCIGQQTPPWNLKLQYSGLEKLDEVVKHCNIPYSDSSSFNTLDIYLPKVGEQFPVVLLIHGGPIHEGIPVKPKDWVFFEQYGKLLANNGLAAVVMNHRLFPGDSFSLSQLDIENTISFLSKNANSYGIDINNIYLWVFSYAAIHFNHFANHKEYEIKKIISFYGVYNDAFPKDDSGSTQTQLLVVRCEKDNANFLKGSDNLIHFYTKNKYNISIINIPGGIHSFDLLQNNDETEEVINAVLEFLKQ